MKPTLKEVKEYFKDAETIRCLTDTNIKPYTPNYNEGVHCWGLGIWSNFEDILGEIDSVELWNEEQGFAEIITYKTNSKMKTLSRKDYKRIYDIACSTWKPKLQEWYSNKFAIEDEINIKDSEYKLMRNACTDEQNKLFDEIFGADQKELEIGKWYKGSMKDSIYYLESVKTGLNPHVSYGIDGDGNWVNAEDRNLYECKEATQKEVETALIKEAEKRGFKEGVKFKTIDRLLHDGSINKGGEKFNITDINMCYYPSEKETTLLNNGWGTIFHNGKWAEIIEQPKEKTYKIGQRLKHNDSKEKYILAQISTKKVSLICLNDGKNWDVARKVKDLEEITAEELNKITDNLTEDFTLYKE